MDVRGEGDSYFNPAGILYRASAQIFFPLLGSFYSAKMTPETAFEQKNPNKTKKKKIQ